MREIFIITPEQMAAAKWRPDEFVLIDGEIAWRVQQEHARGQAEARGAFRALAEIGLAIAAGGLLLFAEDRSNDKHSPEFLRRKGGSCDACTEASIFASVIRRALLVQA